MVIICIWLAYQALKHSENNYYLKLNLTTAEEVVKVLRLTNKGLLKKRAELAEKIENLIDRNCQLFDRLNELEPVIESEKEPQWGEREADVFLAKYHKAFDETAQQVYDEMREELFNNISELNWYIEHTGQKELKDMLEEYYQYDIEDFVRYIYKSEPGKLAISEKHIWPHFHKISMTEFKCLHGWKFEKCWLRVRENDTKEIALALRVKEENLRTRIKAAPYVIFDFDLKFINTSFVSRCPEITIEVFKELVRMRNIPQTSPKP